jgi:hypothetical protein
VHLIVRAARDRSVGREQKLFAACADWPEAGRYLIKVAAKRGKYGKGQRAERTALVAVRFGEVTFKRSACAGRDLPASLTMRVVDVREVDPPEDPKQRVHWCLRPTSQSRPSGQVRGLPGTRCAGPSNRCSAR